MLPNTFSVSGPSSSVCYVSTGALNGTARDGHLAVRWRPFPISCFSVLFRSLSVLRLFLGPSIVQRVRRCTPRDVVDQRCIMRTSLSALCPPMLSSFFTAGGGERGSQSITGGDDGHGTGIRFYLRPGPLPPDLIATVRVCVMEEGELHAALAAQGPGCVSTHATLSPRSPHLILYMNCRPNPLCLSQLFLRSNLYTFARAHTLSHTHTYTLTCAHTRISTHVHTHTRSHTHTHTHTHIAGRHRIVA